MSSVARERCGSQRMQATVDQAAAPPGPGEHTGRLAGFPNSTTGLGLGCWAMPGLLTDDQWPCVSSKLLGDTVTCSFLAVVISGIKSLSSNLPSSDTCNGLGGGFAIILFQYLWNPAAPYGFWAFTLPFRYPSHKFSMIISFQLENLHLYALSLGQRPCHRFGVMFWICDRSIASPD